jgi:hypothetical protein
MGLHQIILRVPNAILPTHAGLEGVPSTLFRDSWGLCLPETSLGRRSPGIPLLVFSWIERGHSRAEESGKTPESWCWQNRTFHSLESHLLTQD